jgi:hypothetical protein
MGLDQAGSQGISEMSVRIAELFETTPVNIGSTAKVRDHNQQ